MGKIIGIDLGTTNSADALIHSTRSAMSRFERQIDAADKTRIEQLIADLEQEMKGKDQAAIERKSGALGDESSRILGQAEAGAAAPPRGAPQPGRPDDDDVVDAEFEEVDP